jgi:hypothetical protein
LGGDRSGVGEVARTQPLVNLFLDIAICCFCKVHFLSSLLAAMDAFSRLSDISILLRLVLTSQFIRYFFQVIDFELKLLSIFLSFIGSWN